MLIPLCTLLGKLRRRLVRALAWASLPLFGLSSAGLVEAAPGMGETPVLAICEDFFPYTGVVDGQAAGLGIELVGAAYAAAGVRVEYRPLPFARCLAEAERGLVLGCLAIGQDAASIASGKLFANRLPVFSIVIKLYVKADSPLHALGLEDLGSLRVAVAKDAAYGEVFERNTRSNRVEVLNEVTGLRLLARGRADVALVDSRSFAYLVRSNPQEFAGKFRDATRPGNFTPTLGFAGFSPLHPQSRRYAHLLDQGLATIKVSGEYERISERWVSTTAPPTGLR